jgi:hypothetical protein
MENSKAIKLTHDELFIIMGMIALNSNDDSKFRNALSAYNREKNTIEVTISEPLIDELLRICQLHKNQNGTVLKVIAKITMTKELVVIDAEYYKKISMVEDKYKNQIIKLASE